MSEATPEVLFAAALAAFQSELPHVAKAQRADAGAYGYDYADLTDVTEAAMPLLSKHGLSFTAKPTVAEVGFVLRYALLHEGGHREGGDFPLPDPARFDSQKIGSGITYARRYCLCAVTGIAPGGDDDDGEGAKGATARDPLRAPVPVTDFGWLEDARQRLNLSTTAAEVEAIVEEGRQVYREHRLAGPDAAAFKAETDQRLAEVTGAVA